MDQKTKLIFSVFLIAIGVICRLLPHVWNFTPIAAIALFAGVYLGRNYALALPALTMLIGDFFIGFYDWKLMLAVYASYLLIGLLGVMIKKHKSVEIVGAGSLLGSVIFFIITNYAVWQFSPWYAKSVQGLVECYTLALPFLRNALLGDLFYAAVFFGAYEAVIAMVKRPIIQAWIFTPAKCRQKSV